MGNSNRSVYGYGLCIKQMTMVCFNVLASLGGEDILSREGKGYKITRKEELVDYFNGLTDLFKHWAIVRIELDLASDQHETLDDAIKFVTDYLGSDLFTFCKSYIDWNYVHECREQI